MILQISVIVSLSTANASYLYSERMVAIRLPISILKLTRYPLENIQRQRENEIEIEKNCIGKVTMRFFLEQHSDLSLSQALF